MKNSEYATQLPSAFGVILIEDRYLEINPAKPAYVRELLFVFFEKVYNIISMSNEDKSILYYSRVCGERKIMGEKIRTVKKKNVNVLSCYNNYYTYIYFENNLFNQQ